jgi:predicted phosphodiesterase
LKTALVWLLVLVVVSMIVLPHSFVYAKSKAEKSITKAIGRAVEGNWKAIDMVNISKTNDNGTITVYNKTGGVPIPTPTPSPVPPNPLPPSGNVSKVCLVGDFKDGIVVSKMKDCNVKISLGDSGYGSNLNLLKSLGFTKCVIGNHDSEEDGSSAIYQEALAYCGDHWSLKISNGHVLILGFNTNGDQSIQLSVAKKSLADSKVMENVSTVIFVSHKGGHVPPNSHHPAEAATLYKQLEAIVPTNVKLIEVFGHNHVSSSAPSMNWYQAGAGGKSFYSCGTDAVWTYCDNKNESYLELTISNSDGATAAKFIK